MKLTRREYYFIAVIWGFTALIIAGMAYYFIYYKNRAYRIMADISVSPPSKVFVPHPVYGYAMAPGSYEITIDKKKIGVSRKFSVAIGEDGYRTTSADPERYRGKPEIWIFGCSFTWGWPLDNGRVYPWLIQSSLREYSVVNLAVNGFGNVHALAQLREILSRETTPPPPRFAIFTYAPFHGERNVAAPSRLRAYLSINPFMNPGMRHLRASLDDGKLSVYPVKFTDIPAGATDPPDSVKNAVTIAIFEEIFRLCAENGIVPLLGVLEGENDDPVIKRCRALGYRFLDLRVDYRDKRYNCMPADPHPNEAAHEIYAKRVIEVIRLLEKEKTGAAP